MKHIFVESCIKEALMPVMLECNEELKIKLKIEEHVEIDNALQIPLGVKNGDEYFISIEINAKNTDDYAYYKVTMYLDNSWGEIISEEFKVNLLNSSDLKKFSEIFRTLYKQYNDISEE